MRFVSHTAGRVLARKIVQRALGYYFLYGRAHHVAQSPRSRRKTVLSHEA
jgi:hypothetical protein